MNARICDCCGKKLTPINTFYVTIKAEYLALRYPSSVRYDLCTDCMEIVRGVIKKNISKEGME